MSNKYEDYEDYEDLEDYEEEKPKKKKRNKKRNSNVIKKFLTVLLVIAIIILIILLLKGCTGSNPDDGGETKPNNPIGSISEYESALLEAGKTYFENNTDLLPTEKGECTRVELDTLMDKGLINPDKYSSCDVKGTYLMACVLENNEIHYTPWLTCNDKNSNSEYTELKPGTLNDVVEDSSYIEFRYIPQILVSSSTASLGKVEELWKQDIKYSSYKTLATTTYYRFRDAMYKWEYNTKSYYSSKGSSDSSYSVNEYYPTKPNNEYTISDGNATTVYKWYKELGTKHYCPGIKTEKCFAPVAPDGYPNADVETKVNVPLYRSRTITGSYAPYKYYGCSYNKTTDVIVYQQETPCGQGSNKDYTVEREIIYSCTNAKEDTGKSVMGSKVASASSTCHSYSNWSQYSDVVKCDTTNKETCQQITVPFYSWYSLTSTREYYNSKSSNAADENIYYASAPAKGYIKDENTKTTGYKWYKETTKTTDYTATKPFENAIKTNDVKYTEWSEWSTIKPSKDSIERSVESKVKVKLQQITGTSSSDWKNLTTDYVPFKDMITAFKNNNYNVSTLSDINSNGELNYKLQMLIRNKKEVSN